MLILSIETSCDETAVSLVQADGEFPHATYEILGDALWSQIGVHREYGGVVPGLGKREHAERITSLLKDAIEEAELLENSPTEISSDVERKLHTTLMREEGLVEKVLAFFADYSLPHIDLITVTNGPGLEPALWVGVSFAKAIALVTGAPVVPTNHMEGHILASLYDTDRDNQLSDIEFPALALLISGGHTELLLMKNWSEYEKIGQTVDDAVGEAFDKVARLIGLPYPGGPEIGKRAAVARKKNYPEYTKLPAPMLHSGDLNFSFSGLKTAVRYAVADKELSEEDVAAISRDFEDVVTTVLLKKVNDAIEMHGIKTVIVGGGVSASQHIKYAFEKNMLEHYPDVNNYFPKPGLSTDNSIMIALAGHAHATSALSPDGASIIAAEGNKQHRRIPIGSPIL